MFVVMRLVVEDATNVHFDPASGLIGLLPVYKTREDAEREWPGSSLVEIGPVADALEGK